MAFVHCSVTCLSKVRLLDTHTPRSFSVSQDSKGISLMRPAAIFDDLFNNWVESDVILIKDLLKDNGSYLSFQEFSDKFACRTNFLQYYQIISAIPNQLLLKARQVDLVNKEYFTSNDHFFYFNNNLGIKLDKAKSRDFYQLLIAKTHTGGHTGPKRWT